MSELMQQLRDVPLVWVLVTLVAVAVVGTPLCLVWERGRPTSYTRSREYLEQQQVWQAKSAVAQAAHDEAVLDAAEAADRLLAARREAAAARRAVVGEAVVRAADERLGPLYEVPVDGSSVTATAELIVEAEHARSITDR